MSTKPRIVLGIESSCDETAVALVTSERQILAERIASQTEEHAPYGGGPRPDRRSDGWACHSQGVGDGI